MSELKSSSINTRKESKHETHEPTTGKCAICFEEFPLAELEEFDGEMRCLSCLEAETVICCHCGRRLWIDENAGSSSVPLCERCFDNHYTTCTDCDRVLHRDNAYYDDDEPYCPDCYSRHNDSRSIHDYYYKPTPIFYGESERYFGVELEVDGAGECDDCAEDVIYTANINGLEHIYCKHDGSLDEGFEIVTHPMTLNYHSSEMPWAKVLTQVKNMGYLSHKAGTCGLHVHVNRSSLGDTDEKRDACIARILYFVEKHWDELLKFSRRTNRQLDRWAARYGYKEHPKELLDHAKKGTDRGRYSCINLENYATIEFRIFRGTLKYNTLIATLQLVNRICDVAFALSDDEVKAMSWTTFVSGCTEPELIQYLKERRIYINELVSEEEDV